MPVRWMSKTEAYAFLAAGTEGRLATCNTAGQPYITPLNYLCHEGKIYFHCKQTGRKLDNIAQNNRVCFEVSGAAHLAISDDRPCACSTRYTCVLAFGTARAIEGNAGKAALLNLLVEKFAAGKPCQPIDEQNAARCAVMEIAIDEISGKINFAPE